MKKKIKFGFIFLSAIAVIGVIVATVIQPPAVECVVLEESILENTFNEIGEVIPLGESDLYTKIGGKLLEVNATEGSPVKKGDLLFVFDGGDFKNEEEGILAEMAVIDSQINSQILTLETQIKSLESAKASLQIQAEQALIMEKKQSEDLESAKLLYDNGVIPAQDLNDAQIAYELSVKNTQLLNTQLKYSTEQIYSVTTQVNELRGKEDPRSETGGTLRQQLMAQRAALEVQLNVLREKQNEIEVIAPLGGIIRDFSLKNGQIVPAGIKLCSVYQPDAYRIDCYILIENTAGIKVGDEVEITLSMQDEDKLFMGSITRIAPDAADRISKAGLSEKRIKIEIAPKEGSWEGLGPYWPVEVRFVTAQAKNCLIAPKTALVEDMDDVWKVWTVQAGKAVEVIVKRGVQTPSQVEIKGDLAPGDIIIKNVKTSKISPGQRVRAVL